jgi:hypothetical protein
VIAIDLNVPLPAWSEVAYCPTWDEATFPAESDPVGNEHGTLQPAWIMESHNTIPRATKGSRQLAGRTNDHLACPFD